MTSGKRILSLLLAIVLFVGVMPTQVAAASGLITYDLDGATNVSAPANGNFNSDYWAQLYITVENTVRGLAPTKGTGADRKELDYWQVTALGYSSGASGTIAVYDDTLDGLQTEPGDIPAFVSQIQVTAQYKTASDIIVLDVIAPEEAGGDPIDWDWLTGAFDDQTLYPDQGDEWEAILNAAYPGIDTSLPGYTFSHWEVDGIDVTGTGALVDTTTPPSVTAQAIFTKKSGTFFIDIDISDCDSVDPASFRTYYPVDGSITPAFLKAIFTGVTVTKGTEAFDGWYLLNGTDLYKKVDGVTGNITASHNLVKKDNTLHIKAVFKENTTPAAVKVVMKKNAVWTNGITTINLTYGDTWGDVLDALEAAELTAGVPTVSGYKFMGWIAGSESGAKADLSADEGGILSKTLADAGLNLTVYPNMVASTEVILRAVEQGNSARHTITSMNPIYHMTTGESWASVWADLENVVPPTPTGLVGQMSSTPIFVGWFLDYNGTQPLSAATDYNGERYVYAVFRNAVDRDIEFITNSDTMATVKAGALPVVRANEASDWANILSGLNGLTKSTYFDIKAGYEFDDWYYFDGTNYTLLSDLAGSTVANVDNGTGPITIEARFKAKDTVTLNVMAYNTVTQETFPMSVLNPSWGDTATGLKGQTAGAMLLASYDADLFTKLTTLTDYDYDKTTLNSETGSTVSATGGSTLSNNTSYDIYVHVAPKAGNYTVRFAFSDPAVTGDLPLPFLVKNGDDWQDILDAVVDYPQNMTVGYELEGWYVSIGGALSANKIGDEGYHVITPSAVVDPNGYITIVANVKNISGTVAFKYYAGGTTASPPFPDYITDTLPGVENTSIWGALNTMLHNNYGTPTEDGYTFAGFAVGDYNDYTPLDDILLQRIVDVSRTQDVIFPIMVADSSFTYWPEPFAGTNATTNIPTATGALGSYAFDDEWQALLDELETYDEPTLTGYSFVGYAVGDFNDYFLLEGDVLAKTIGEVTTAQDYVFPVMIKEDDITFLARRIGEHGDNFDLEAAGLVQPFSINANQTYQDLYDHVQGITPDHTDVTLPGVDSSWKFIGWYLDTDGNTSLSSVVGDPYVYTDGHVFALFEKKASYKITFTYDPAHVVSGSTFQARSFYEGETWDLVPGKIQTVTNAIPTRFTIEAGYEFDDWYYNGQPLSYYGNAALPNQDIELEARFKETGTTTINLIGMNVIGVEVPLSEIDSTLPTTITGYRQGMSVQKALNDNINSLLVGGVTLSTNYIFAGYSSDTIGTLITPTTTLTGDSYNVYIFVQPVPGKLTVIYNIVDDNGVPQTALNPPAALIDASMPWDDFLASLVDPATITTGNPDEKVKNWTINGDLLDDITATTAADVADLNGVITIDGTLRDYGIGTRAYVTVNDNGTNLWGTLPLISSGFLWGQTWGDITPFLTSYALYFVGQTDYKFLHWMVGTPGSGVPLTSVTAESFEDTTHPLIIYPEVAASKQVRFRGPGGNNDSLGQPFAATTFFSDAGWDHVITYLAGFSDPTRAGMVFEGWFLDQNDKSRPLSSMAGQAFTESADQTTVWAHFRTVDRYAINLDSADPAMATLVGSPTVESAAETDLWASVKGKLNAVTINTHFNVTPGYHFTHFTLGASSMTDLPDGDPVGYQGSGVTSLDFTAHFEENDPASITVKVYNQVTGEYLLPSDLDSNYSDSFTATQGLPFVDIFDQNFPGLRGSGNINGTGLAYVSTTVDGTGMGTARVADQATHEFVINVKLSANKIAVVFTVDDSAATGKYDAATVPASILVDSGIPKADFIAAVEAATAGFQGDPATDYAVFDWLLVMQGTTYAGQRKDLGTLNSTNIDSTNPHMVKNGNLIEIVGVLEDLTTDITVTVANAHPGWNGPGSFTMARNSTWADVLDELNKYPAPTDPDYRFSYWRINPGTDDITLEAGASVLSQHLYEFSAHTVNAEWNALTAITLRALKVGSTIPVPINTPTMPTVKLYDGDSWSDAETALSGITPTHDYMSDGLFQGWYLDMDMQEPLSGAGTFDGTQTTLYAMFRDPYTYNLVYDFDPALATLSQSLPTATVPETNYWVTVHNFLSPYIIDAYFTYDAETKFVGWYYGDELISDLAAANTPLPDLSGSVDPLGFADLHVEARFAPKDMITFTFYSGSMALGYWDNVPSSLKVEKDTEWQVLEAILDASPYKPTPITGAKQDSWFLDGNYMGNTAPNAKISAGGVLRPNFIVDTSLIRSLFSSLFSGAGGVVILAGPNDVDIDLNGGYYMVGATPVSFTNHAITPGTTYSFLQLMIPTHNDPGAYQFDYWYTLNASGNEVQINYGDTAVGGTTVYAKYKQIAYIVNLLPGTGNAIQGQPTFYIPVGNTWAYVLNAISAAGTGTPTHSNPAAYFTGWQIAGGVMIDTITGDQLTGDTNLVAQFSDQITILVDLDGGTASVAGAPGQITISAAQATFGGLTAILNQQIGQVTRSGFDFVEWLADGASFGADTASAAGVTVVTASWRTTPVTTTPSLSAASWYYDGTAHTVSITGTQAGDDVTYTVDGTALGVNILPSFTDAGSYTVSAVVDRGGQIINVPAVTVTVMQLPVTIQAQNAGKTQGVADPTLSATVTITAPGFSGTATALAGLTYTVERDPGNAVGSYAISVIADPAVNSNYAITTGPATFTISAAGTGTPTTPTTPTLPGRTNPGGTVNGPSRASTPWGNNARTASYSGGGSSGGGSSTQDTDNTTGGTVTITDEDVALTDNPFGVDGSDLTAGVNSNPGTGDSSPIALSVLLLGLSGAAALLTRKKKDRGNRK